MALRLVCYGRPNSTVICCGYVVAPKISFTRFLPKCLMCITTQSRLGRDSAYLCLYGSVVLLPIVSQSPVRYTMDSAKQGKDYRYRYLSYQGSRQYCASMSVLYTCTSLYRLDALSGQER